MTFCGSIPSWTLRSWGHCWCFCFYGKLKKPTDTLKFRCPLNISSRGWTDTFFPQITLMQRKELQRRALHIKEPDELCMKHSSLVSTVPALWEEGSDRNNLRHTLAVVFQPEAVMRAAGLRANNVAPPLSPWGLRKVTWQQGAEDLFWAKRGEREEKAGRTHQLRKLLGRAVLKSGGVTARLTDPACAH